MSIQSEINRIKANVSDCFSAVRETGVEVADGAKSDTLAASIRCIPDAVLADVNTLLDEINGVEI